MKRKAKLQMGWCARMAAVTIRLIVAVAVTVAGLAQAVPVIAERDDGSVMLVSEGQQFILPAETAARVAAATRQHLDDPPQLRAAINAILDSCGDCTRNEASAVAVVAFAVFHARGRPAAIDAIVSMALNRLPNLSGRTLLAVVATSSPRNGNGNGNGAPLAQLQATVENPSTVSPVE